MACEAFDGLLDFVIGRLFQAPSKFPRTIFALLGEPGLRQRGKWTSRMREFAEQLADEPYPYWASWDLVDRGDPRPDR